MGQNSAAAKGQRLGESEVHTPAAAAAPAAARDTMLSLQDSVFFEISIKSLLKSWSSSCEYIRRLGGRNVEVFSRRVLAGSLELGCLESRRLGVTTEEPWLARDDGGRGTGTEDPWWHQPFSVLGPKTDQPWVFLFISVILAKFLSGSKIGEKANK